ncbi:MAG: hypothetical protein WBR29_03065 [Gammaproteobacteria bacterium]
MANRPWGIGQARRQATQPFRAGNAIQMLQGDPLGRLQPGIARSLRIPLDPSAPATGQGGVQLPAAQINAEIYWTTTVVNPSSAPGADYIIQGFPNRVVLFVTNNDPANPIAYNFDQTAAVTGSSPNYQVQGQLLYPSQSIYIDRWCPTGTVHLAGNASTSVTQAFSAIGNFPGLGE